MQVEHNVREECRRETWNEGWEGSCFGNDLKVCAERVYRVQEEIRTKRIDRLKGNATACPYPIEQSNPCAR